MAEATPPRAPSYPFLAYLLAAVAGLVSIASTAILVAESGWTPGMSVALGIIAVVIVCATMIAQRQARIREDIAALSRQVDGLATNSVSGLGHGLAFGEQVVGMLRHLTRLLDLLVVESMASHQLQQEMAALRTRMAELAAQQETLAELATAGGSVVLDVATGDVYELGKRVGRDELLREQGKDQTP